MTDQNSATGKRKLTGRKKDPRVPTQQQPRREPHRRENLSPPFARKTQTTNKQKSNLQDDPEPDLVPPQSPSPSPWPSWSSRDVPPPTRSGADDLIRRQSGSTATPGARFSTCSITGEKNEDLDTILSSLFITARRFPGPPPYLAPSRPPETERTGGIAAGNSIRPLFALLPCR
jgi:hypothetical protein